jgi:hypothetical protein
VGAPDVRRARHLWITEFSTLEIRKVDVLATSSFPTPAVSTRAPSLLPSAVPVVPAGLLDALESVPDPRDPRGVRCRLPTLLAVGSAR